jgi:hypothetical protein
MAGFAFLSKQVASGGDVGRVGAERIRPFSRRPRHARVQKPSCDSGFDLRLPGSGARKTWNEALIKNARQEDHGEYSGGSNEEPFAGHLKAPLGDAAGESQPTAEVGGIANDDCHCGNAQLHVEARNKNLLGMSVHAQPPRQERVLRRAWTGAV